MSSTSLNEATHVFERPNYLLFTPIRPKKELIMPELIRNKSRKTKKIKLTAEDKYRYAHLFDFIDENQKEYNIVSP
jgi:hypothetical protein